MESTKVPEATAPPYPEVGPSSIPGIDAGEEPPSYEATTAAPNSLPPTYQSLYGEFRKVDNPRSLAQFLGKAFTALINTVTAAVTIAFLNIIPLFMIILGSINLHNCQIEPRIPVWLIISGTTYLLKSAINFFRMKVYKDRQHRQTPPDQGLPRGCKNPFRIVLSALALFTIVWFIVGSIWVYRVYHEVNYDEERISDHCDQFTYLFSFIYATFGYAACLLSVCCFCCCCCCVCCRRRDRTYD